MNLTKLDFNTIYTTTDVLDIFGISERTYYRRKSEFHEYLDLYFNYQVWGDGYRQYYIFIDAYEEEIPPFRHQRVITKSIDNTVIYTEIIDKEIERNPFFTASSLALDLYNNAVFPLEHSVRTARYYITKILKSNKYSKSKPVWCKKVWNEDLLQAEYIPMTEDEVSNFKEIVSSLSQIKEDIELTMNFYEGTITPEEYFRKHNENWKCAYKEAKHQFFKQYGFMPNSVRPIEIGAF